MFLFRTRKNSNRLYRICIDLIEQYEKENNKICPSARNDLGKLINSRIKAAKKEISEWKDHDTDYIKIAHTMLAHAAFDLLASGNYHIYYGILNPMNCSANLMIVYKKSMQYALENGLIDENTREDQYNYLLSCISQVG